MAARGVASAVQPPARADSGIPLTFDTADLLHLLWIHQAILAHRPIDRGNKAYLAALVAASQTLASGLAATSAAHARAAELARLCAEIATGNVANAAALSRRILPLIRACDPDAGLRTSTHDLYLVRTLRPLRDVDELFVLFGPGLGMGDEISCLQFVRQGLARFGAPRTTVFSSYPGLWTVLLPEVRSRYCWANPLRPYRSIRLSASARTTLVIAIDFDGNGLHHAVLPRIPSMDVLEIALGLRRAWLRRGTDPWIDTIEASSRDEVGNYEWLSGMWAALDPHAAGAESWRPLAPARRPASAAPSANVLLNPLSSKPVPWGPDDWAAMFGTIARTLPERDTIRVRVYPGVDANSAAEARSVVAALEPVPRVDSAPTHESLTPHNGLRAIAREMGRADVCVTIDTFTAHLAPLFGVPTVVITLKDNRAFWVPSPWSFYVTPAEVPMLVPVLVVALLAPDQLAIRHHVQHDVRRATAAIASSAEPSAAVADLIAGLALLVAELEGRSPLASTGRQWLRFWSRVSTAVRRSPVGSRDLAHFVHSWKSSTFYRLFAEAR